MDEETVALPTGRRAGDWRIHGVSVEGYRHRRSGIPCQDAHLYTVSGPPRSSVTVLAVADGAGSRPRSDEGSVLAVELAVDRFADRAAGRAGGRPRTGAEVQAALREAFHDVRTEFLRRTGQDADQFATTLTVVVLTPTWIGHVSVGDGFAVLRAGTVDGVPQFHLLPQPAAVSEYSNETVFLTSADAERRLSTACVTDPGVDGVLLSTDGLAQVALSWTDGQPRRPKESFVAAVLRTLDRPGADPEEDHRALAELLRSDRLTAVNADDKTLLRAVRR
ncbi:PP2C family serine/threonine-protein phosphatase [Streptacidiphilus sp. N1-12]|uniref:PP2C family serine/threonine-protein phosphatase n=2 Tax=Streptacidiphilus alkalitolerans TaxID=3342712 RepID=A0ABV6WFS3_9ACTN